MKNKRFKKTGVLILCLLIGTLNVDDALGQSRGQKKAHFGQWEPQIFDPQWPRSTVVTGYTYSGWRSQVVEKLYNNDPLISAHFLDIFDTRIDDVLAGEPSISDPNADKANWSRIVSINNQQLAYYAKLAAFIYYANIDIGNSGAEFNSTARNAYRDKAKNYLTRLTTDFNFTKRKVKYIFSGLTKEDLQYQSKALIMALQAYDLLYSANLHANGTVDADWLKETKYNLQEWTSDIYRKANDVAHAFSFKNNQSLMPAAALGMAAVILNDCGNNRWRFTYHPDRWANRGNYEIQRALFQPGLFDNAMSSSDGKAGYAEGPYYFKYAFENVLPFLIAYNSVLPDDVTRHYFQRESGPIGTDVRSHLHDPKYKELMQWYAFQIMPGGKIAPFDDSYNYMEHGYLINCYNFYVNLTRSWPFNWIDGTDGGTGTGMDVDYIASAIPVKPTDQKDVLLEDAGVGILQNKDYSFSAKDRIYLNLLGERNESASDRFHEHADLSSFIISAGDDQLIIDPGYLGSKHTKATNAAEDHNLILVKVHNGNGLTGVSGPDRDTEPIDFSGPEKGFSREYIPQLETGEGAPITTMTLKYAYEGVYFERKITSYTFSNYYYYDIDDNLYPTSEDPMDYLWNINGNGNQGELTFDFIDSERRIFDYKHPCQIGENRWSIRGVLAVNDGATSRFVTTDEISEDLEDRTIHSNHAVGGGSEGWVTDPKPTCTGCSSARIGFHTRYQASKENISGHTRFHSIFIPYRCGATDIPGIILHSDSNTITLIGLKIGDKDVAITHSPRFLGDTNTITDPYDTIGVPGDLVYDAEYVSFLVAAEPSLTKGYCTAHTHFRGLTMNNGRFVKFNDTNYVSSDIPVNVGFALDGKCRYTGYVELLEEGMDAVVTFYMPDTIAGGNFVIRDLSGGEITPSDYDAGARMLTCTFSVSTRFYIELDDPCLISCFFPPTAMTIDTLFDFNTGTFEHLGHDLSIEQSIGHLRITNGSKMNICEGYYLANRDSITMKGILGDGEEAFVEGSCGIDMVPQNPHYIDGTGF